MRIQLATAWQTAGRHGVARGTSEDREIATLKGRSAAMQAVGPKISKAFKLLDDAEALYKAKPVGKK
jgi:hypothetical protein